MSDILEFMRGFAEDHEPDGWPAIKMRQVTELCDMVEALRQRVVEIEQERDEYACMSFASALIDCKKQLADEKLCHAETREQLAAVEKELAEAHEWSSECEKIIAASQEAERQMSVHTVTLTRRIEELERICRDAYEIYAGSEGFPAPTTASEAYLYQQLHLMKDEIARGLKEAHYCTKETLLDAHAKQVESEEHQ